MPHKLQFIVILLATLCMSGCISYRSENGTLDQAVPTEDVLAELQLGMTTTDWLLERLGPPQAVSRPTEETFIWQYENTATSRKAIRALPLLAITLENTQATVYNFEIENDYIVRFWKDR